MGRGGARGGIFAQIELSGQLKRVISFSGEGREGLATRIQNEIAVGVREGG